MNTKMPRKLIKMVFIPQMNAKISEKSSKKRIHMAMNTKMPVNLEKIVFIHQMNTKISGKLNKKRIHKAYEYENTNKI